MWGDQTPSAGPVDAASAFAPDEACGPTRPRGVWVMGRLGDSEGRGEEAELRPREVSAVSHASVAEVSAGPFHAAVSTEGGDLYTWGANFFGQLGHEESSAHSRSETEEFKTKFKEVGGVVVDAMDLVVRSRVTIDAEGAARSSAGDARAVRALALVKAYTGHKVSHVSCGGAHTVAVCEQGVALVFGCNAHGQLGPSHGAKPSAASLSSGAIFGAFHTYKRAQANTRSLACACARARARAHTHTHTHTHTHRRSLGAAFACKTVGTAGRTASS